jgi:hypothetical protein
MGVAEDELDAVFPEEDFAHHKSDRSAFAQTVEHLAFFLGFEEGVRLQDLVAIRCHGFSQVDTYPL